MIALPLCILALAAGVYLLIKVNREYLGGIFKVFAWLIIVLSLLAIVGTVGRVIHRHHMMKMHRMEFMHSGPEHCGMHGGGPGGCCGMQKGLPMGSACTMAHDSVCPMGACKMEGDSIVLDRAVCEKMMGKESCEKLCKDRGRCIMTKDECAKMCGGEKACCRK